MVESASHSWIYSGVCSAPDSRGRWFTKKGRQPTRPLRPVLEGAIDLVFSLFDSHRPTDRSRTGFVLAIAKADLPSPNPVFGQLNDGVFYSLVFHDMRPPMSGARHTPKRLPGMSTCELNDSAGAGRALLFRGLQLTLEPLNRIGFEGVGAGALEALELARTLTSGREGKHHRRAALRTKPGLVGLSHP